MGVGGGGGAVVRMLGSGLMVVKGIGRMGRENGAYLSMLDRCVTPV